ncbi:MAG: integration host factor subunit beta [Deltaproteobacteria bacterium]|jgi:integration host factor subunit beta|nr:integration host factor subunit beta [Deltaproteobacteria bacterium]|tara:strand:- start:139 stop:429 length:291 start_codon:yes stop_codon:yes gene_type:complete
MTKSELMDALAESRGISRRTAEEVVNVVFDGMRDSLKSGGRIEIRGFGSFKVRRYKGRTGRNPKTGEEIKVNPKVLPVFKVSKLLRELINKDLENS